MAVVVDIDLGAGAGDDLIDRLAALTDHITDLLGIDLDLNDLGRVLADLFPGSNVMGRSSISRVAHWMPDELKV